MYWESVKLLVAAIAGGQAHDSIAVWPAPSGAAFGPLGAGVFAYGADGAYDNGALIGAHCFVAYEALSPECPQVPDCVRTGMATLRFTYTRVNSNEDRAVNCWRETIVKHATSVALNPFMRYATLTAFGLEKDAEINNVVKKVNRFFSRSRSYRSVGRSSSARETLPPWGLQCGVRSRGRSTRTGGVTAVGGMLRRLIVLAFTSGSRSGRFHIQIGRSCSPCVAVRSR